MAKFSVDTLTIKSGCATITAAVSLKPIPTNSLSLSPPFYIALLLLSTTTTTISGSSSSSFIHLNVTPWHFLAALGDEQDRHPFLFPFLTVVSVDPDRRNSWVPPHTTTTIPLIHKSFFRVSLCLSCHAIILFFLSLALGVSSSKLMRHLKRFWLERLPYTHTTYTFKPFISSNGFSGFSACLSLSCAIHFSVKENLHVYMTSSGNTSSFYNNARLHDCMPSPDGERCGFWQYIYCILLLAYLLLATGWKLNVVVVGKGISKMDA